MILYVNYVIIKFIKAFYLIPTLRDLLFKKVLGKWRNMDYTRFMEGADVFAVLIPLITMAFLSRFGQNIANNINQKNHKKIFVQFKNRRILGMYLLWRYWNVIFFYYSSNKTRNTNTFKKICNSLTTATNKHFFSQTMV